MAKYGSDDLTVEIDDSGSTARDLSDYIDTLDGFNVEALIQESHAFGDSWVEQLYSGVKAGRPFTVGGFYDDTASTGPDAVLNAVGDQRTVTLTWGGSKTSSFEAVIQNYRRIPARGESTRFEATLVPTGTVTEA